MRYQARDLVSRPQLCKLTRGGHIYIYKCVVWTYIDVYPHPPDHPLQVLAKAECESLDALGGTTADA